MDISSRTFLIVSFYTVATQYATEIKKLEQSLHEKELPYKFFGVASRGSWEANCGQKPEIIAKALELFPKHDILFLDADAEVVGKIDFTYLHDLLYKDLPIMARYRKGTELLSGTLLIRNDECGRDLVNQWIVEQQRTPEIWDQRVLQGVLKRLADQKNVIDRVQLPREYTTIFDEPKDWQPVIVHNQASRRLKRAKIQDAVNSYLGMRLNKLPDGSIAIARTNRKVEAYLDSLYNRVPGERRWFAGIMVDENWDILKECMQDKPIYIVGKGPSLDTLTSSDFEPNRAIITLNEAVHKIVSLNLGNKVFALQQDASLSNKCYTPKATMLVSDKAAKFYETVTNKIIFHLTDLGLSNTISAIIAATIAAKSGASMIRLYGFDAILDGNCNYAKSIDDDPVRVGRIERFIGHGNKLRGALSRLGLPHAFATHSVPSLAPDIPNASPALVESGLPEEVS